MAQYNYLSGSSIDNVTSFLFEALKNEQCYLGYSRGVPQMQWGVSALVYVEHINTITNDATNFPEDIAKIGDDFQTSKFFDLNSLDLIAGAADSNRFISIGSTNNTDTTLSQLTIFNEDQLGSLKLSYLGKNWAIIEGLKYDYYKFLTYSATGSYYILPYNSDKTNVLKILPKSSVNIPYYTQDCSLWTKESSGAAGVLIKSGLQKTINILGETYITGLSDPSTILDTNTDYVLNDYTDNVIHKEFLNSSVSGTRTFYITEGVSGSILIDKMKFVDPAIASATEIYTEINSTQKSQKYLTFRYPYTTITSDQYIKLIVGTKDNNELGIWNEVLPYQTTIPTSDANPPGLDISYLKNPVINTSIFDVKGLIKIQSGEVEFIKEMFNNADRIKYQNLGFTIETVELNGTEDEHLGYVKSLTNVGSTTIPLNDFHTFVIGDIIDPFGTVQYTVVATDYSFGASSITINQGLTESLEAGRLLKSNPTDVAAIITLAKTSDLNKALVYGFSSALISKEVDLVGEFSPTEDVYRQLFISFAPKDSLGNVCTDYIYRDIFNSDNFEYNVGLLFYLANKMPIYRKWANVAEKFKIIL